MSDDKTMQEIFRVLCTYLLYERQEETEIRLAFAHLVQERHVRLHDKDEENPSQFTECSNGTCIKALEMLQTARKPRIEMNDLSVQLIRNYNIKVQRDSVSRRCIAFLEEIEAVKPAEKGLILEV
jgi:hypothetical protein